MPSITEWQQQPEAQNNSHPHPKKLFFWQTTSPGHPGCDNFTQPTKSAEEMEQLIASVELCNRHKIKGQNSLVRELFRNRSQQDTAHTTTTKTTTPFSYQFLDA